MPSKNKTFAKTVTFLCRKIKMPHSPSYKTTNKRQGTERNSRTPTPKNQPLTSSLLDHQCRSGLEVSAPDCDIRGQKFKSHHRLSLTFSHSLSKHLLHPLSLGLSYIIQAAFIANTVVICSLGHGLRTFTQPCIHLGSLNRLPASAAVKVGMSPLMGGR